MAMDFSQKIFTTLDKLDSVFQRHNQPGINQSALNQVRSLCIDMKGHDDYITDKASRITRLAIIYYSARKYLKHSGGHESLMTEMGYQLPNVIRSQVFHLISLSTHPKYD
ncbi:hypothetical protein [Pseudomonas sp. OV226]|uniref:hypothetical protein n=1 Tax=Pseudomonas sp. OV226 TaxID=2135588 RepID=UPI000D6B1270|nr:hypothetical protein [Pseudomonas sp. OV226]PWK31772.1 hypothetical protein C7534_12231 [Pseudomonas sp. OV226]